MIEMIMLNILGKQKDTKLIKNEGVNEARKIQNKQRNEKAKAKQNMPNFYKLNVKRNTQNLVSNITTNNLKHQNILGKQNNTQMNKKWKMNMPRKICTKNNTNHIWTRKICTIWFSCNTQHLNTKQNSCSTKIWLVNNNNQNNTKQIWTRPFMYQLLNSNPKNKPNKLQLIVKLQLCWTCSYTDT